MHAIIEQALEQGHRVIFFKDTDPTEKEPYVCRIFSYPSWPDDTVITITGRDCMHLADEIDSVQISDLDCLPTKENCEDCGETFLADQLEDGKCDSCAYQRDQENTEPQ